MIIVKVSAVVLSYYPSKHFYKPMQAISSAKTCSFLFPVIHGCSYYCCKMHSVLSQKLKVLAFIFLSVKEIFVTLYEFDSLVLIISILR